MKITLWFFFALVPLSGASPYASVDFAVVNRWGYFHNYRVAHFRISNTSPDLGASFHGLSAAKIPHGIYDYELVPAPGDASSEKLSGSVDVHRNQIHITRVLETADSLGRRAQVHVSGTLGSRPKGREPVWVILQNVYGTFREESTVDDQGRFQFHHIWGQNVIIVCAGSDVLMSGLLNIGPDETVNYLHINLETQRIQAGLK